MDYRFPFLLSGKKEHPRKDYQKKKITLGTPFGPETSALKSFLRPVGSSRAAKRAAHVEGPQAGKPSSVFGTNQTPAGSCRWSELRESTG